MLYDMMQRFDSNGVFDFLDHSMHPWFNQQLINQTIKTDVEERDDRFIVRKTRNSYDLQERSTLVERQARCV